MEQQKLETETAHVVGEKDLKHLGRWMIAVNVFVRSLTISDFADEPYVHMSILKEDFERINSTDCEGGERPCLVL